MANRTGNFDALSLGGVDARPLLRKTTTLTNAQIKALPTTPIVLVATPGSGFRLVLHLATLLLKAAGGAYTNLNAAGVASINYTGGDLASNYVANDATTSPVLTDFTDLFTGPKASVTLHEFTQVTTPVADEYGNAAAVSADDYDDQGLQLMVDNVGSGAFTGGNVANTLIVTVYYSVEAL